MIDYIIAASKERGIIIAIMYQKDNKITKRNIKVLEFDDTKVTAFCYLRNQLRIFKKENILSASFIKPDGVSDSSRKAVSS